MASQDRIERERGTKESPQQLMVLREKWPLAFPVNEEDVRPLTNGIVREISAALGWSYPYTLGVLAGWKLGRTYCHAVLRHDQRITLDGAPGEPVDAKAKDLATKRLATLAARKAENAAKKAAKLVPATVVKEAPAVRPVTPEELRARVRAALFRRNG
jgi:sRNA-binding protein